MSSMRSILSVCCNISLASFNNELFKTNSDCYYRRLVLSNRKYQCDCEARLQGTVEIPSARKLRIIKCRGCRMRGCLEAEMKEERWNKF
jgi:hypothetical protein